MSAAGATQTSAMSHDVGGNKPERKNIVGGGKIQNKTIIENDNYTLLFISKTKGN